MLDFTSALYLGFRHASRDLPGWDQLTLGKPAALEPVPHSGQVERELAQLIGCERALLATSTLHVFWDLFSILARKPVRIFFDAGSYPIARWGVERVAGLGVRVTTFRAHDVDALRTAMEKNGSGRPVIVADGYCPACGRLAPLRQYVELAEKHRGWVVIDDSQALGIFGERSPWSPYGLGGGGSMQHAGLNRNGSVVIGASLAKAFGAPLAVLAGQTGMLREFESQSATRVHCSPPSAAAIAAAARAVVMNRCSGDSLRLRLFRLVVGLRRGLAQIGLSSSGGAFPVQTLRLPFGSQAEQVHQRLRDWNVGRLASRRRRRAHAAQHDHHCTPHGPGHRSGGAAPCGSGSAHHINATGKEQSMNYRPYYGARRLTYGSLWRRPGTWFGQRYGYGYPRGQSGYRPGYRGWYGGAFRGRWPGYPSYYSRYRQNLPWAYRRYRGYQQQPWFGAVPQVSAPQVGAPAMPPLTPQWVFWAQSCLAQAVGPWVPQTGQIGAATRKAIRIFQSQQQLPSSGMLDAATVMALAQACGGQAASAPAAAPAPAAPAGDDVAAAMAAAGQAQAGGDAGGAPGADAAPPDAAGAADASAGAPAADGTAGEFGRWRRRRFGRMWGGGYQSDDDDGDGGGGGGGGGWGGGWRRRWR